MNIHEYQGKSILKSFGVRVQEGIVSDSVEQAVEAAKKEAGEKKCQPVRGEYLPTMPETWSGGRDPAACGAGVAW